MTAEVPNHGAICERMFVTAAGSAHSRFLKACRHGASIPTVTRAMRELDRVGLDDALRFVLVHADEPDGDFDRVAARWVALLIRETNCTLPILRRIVEALRQLPHYPQVAHRDLADALEELGRHDAAKVLRS